jgi:hypothetical protein
LLKGRVRKNWAGDKPSRQGVVITVDVVNRNMVSGACPRQKAQVRHIRYAKLFVQQLFGDGKIVVLAPMARASEVRAITVKPGLLSSLRAP